MAGNGLLRRLAILLSGEHPTLPLSEVCAVMRAEGIKHQPVARHDQLFLVDAGEGVARALLDRSAYAMEGGRLLSHSPASIDEFRRSCEGIDWGLLEGRSFGAKAKRVRRHWECLDTQKLQAIVGEAATRECDAKVDLKAPDIWIRSVITDAGIFTYALDFDSDRHAFSSRKPKTRPYFHPGVLEPKIARAFVNLCGVRRGDIFADPFCGTGGFLIEAATMGVGAFGMDVDRRMVKGSGKNLRHYGLDADIVLGDARALPISKADGIASDPPYGRGTTTLGQGVREVISGFMESAFGVLKVGGRVCTASPIELRPAALATSAGFRLVEEHRMRVHKSLTRSIIVAERC